MTMDFEASDEAERLKAGILSALVEKLSPYDLADMLAAVGGCSTVVNLRHNLAILTFLCLPACTFSHSGHQPKSISGAHYVNFSLGVMETRPAPGKIDS